jgi:acetyl-CoA synthetase
MVYMSMVPKLAMMMLACALIGAVCLVVFARFSADPIANRVVDAVVSGRRGVRSLPLKLIASAASKKEICKGIVRKVLVVEGWGGG